MNQEKLVQIKELKTYFYTDAGVAKAVDGVSFDIHKGEVLGIVGESGSGKSVTSLSINRLIPDPPGKIESGEIIYDGINLLDIRILIIKTIRYAMTVAYAAPKCLVLVSYIYLTQY